MNDTFDPTKPAPGTGTHPLPGSTWRHYKGGLYTIVDVADNTETGELLVIYRGPDGKVWARPMDLWYDKSLGDMGGVPRFTLVTS